MARMPYPQLAGSRVPPGPMKGGVARRELLNPFSREETAGGA